MLEPSRHPTYASLAKTQYIIYCSNNGAHCLSLVTFQNCSCNQFHYDECYFSYQSFFILSLYILSCIHRELLLIHFDADLSFKILLITEKKSNVSKWFKYIFFHPRPSSTYEMDKLATKEEESPVRINYF